MLTDIRRRGWQLATSALVVLATGSASLQAASPATVAAGRTLFEKQWIATNPSIQSDGLGPLFNGNSCVACHHQGGVGGSGDARFNARTVGIEEVRVAPAPSTQHYANLISGFHRGFVTGGSNVVSTIPLHRHGGTPAFAEMRSSMLSQLPSLRDSAGGPLDAAEVREENANTIVYQQKTDTHQFAVQARVFQRNTTALFGAGLIDAVPVEAIEKQMRMQQRHPEISGRPATLDDGQIGKFGWRANVATLHEFNDQACANEMGLKTRVHDQPKDATLPGYSNPRYDISDDQVEAIHHFVAALPAPIEILPESLEQQETVAQGKRLFEQVGCSVCHTPTLGPATGLYSDLLLHDMGYELRDLNAAEPYVVRATIKRAVIPDIPMPRPDGYYGATLSLSLSNGMTSSTFVPGGSPQYMRDPFVIRPPDYPDPSRIVPLARQEQWKASTDVTGATNRRPQRDTTELLYLQQTIEPTPVTQEWRTAPLWGLRDSAPYMHDGRAATVLEAIALHDGEASGTRDRFLNLSVDQREAVLAFLNTLVAPPNAPQRSQ